VTTTGHWVLLIATILAFMPAAAGADTPLSALAPFEIYVDDFDDLYDLCGIAMDAPSNIYVALQAPGAHARSRAPRHGY
jgi:hypothetical protein